jgi:hypothetical protein
MIPIQNPLSRTFNKSVDVYRSIDVPQTSKEQYILHFSDLPCWIQPYDVEFSEDLEGSFGKNFVMFCPVVDVRIGDKIEDGGIWYKVVGAEDFSDFLGRTTHMELVIRLSNA